MGTQSLSPCCTRVGGLEKCVTVTPSVAHFRGVRGDKDTRKKSVTVTQTLAQSNARRWVRFGCDQKSFVQSIAFFVRCGIHAITDRGEGFVQVIL